jgi:nucleotide-binding universal stress UspA family protein
MKLGRVKAVPAVVEAAEAAAVDVTVAAAAVEAVAEEEAADAIVVGNANHGLKLNGRAPSARPFSIPHL